MSFTLPRLPQILPTYQQAQIWWQQVVEKIEGQEGSQGEILEQLAAQLAAIEAAQAAAELAAAIASERMPAVAPITINADSGGTVNVGQLPRNIQFRRYTLDTDVSTASAWSATLLSGSATFSIGAATGVLQITALATSATIEVVSVHSSVTLTQILSVNKTNAPASGASGGGTSASDSSLSSFNSASHSPVSSDLTVTAGTAGEVALAAVSLSVSTDAFAPTGSFTVYGKWEWDSTGAGAWVDVGTEDASAPGVVITSVGGGDFEMSEGDLTCNEVKTGLTPASSHKFRFSARNNLGSRTMYLAGTVTATGS